MFSPDVTSHGHGLRPKRSRQATEADDSLKLPQAKRKRSALRKDTFEPLAEVSGNENTSRTDEPNGQSVEPTKPAVAPGGSTKNLAFRSSKKTDKRTDRVNAAFTLSSNEFYTVTQLPALPDQIRNSPGIVYSCCISAQNGLAIALTHTDAIVWAYNSAATSPSSREQLTFKLPFPPASASDPLPIAAFTARSATGEPGLVVVSPRWGNITHWETITNASSIVPGQSSSGVHGHLSGLGSGEALVEIVNAEPSGFILSSNHGRVYHVTIRDQMGRPAVNVQMLRKPAAGTIGGIFGSIRHVFGADGRAGVPIIRAGRSSKAQRDIVIVAEDGSIESWNTNVAMGNSLTMSVSMREELVQAIQAHSKDNSVNSWSVKVLDVELTNTSQPSRQLAKKAHEHSVDLVALVLLDLAGQIRYFLVELAVKNAKSVVNVVHPITCYASSSTSELLWRPKLLIPNATDLAFVLFDRAIVLFSLVRTKESPSSQLLLERQATVEPFQDCIKFQPNSKYQLIAATTEEEDKSEDKSTIVAAVDEFGVIRLSANNLKSGSDDDEEGPVPHISAKTKLEQAIFFGNALANPLDLKSSTLGQIFSAEEICDAALQISVEILTSTSNYLPKSTPSIDAQLKLRAQALEDLAQFLSRHYADYVFRTTKFNLLWNAEKLSAAQTIWQIQQEIERHYGSLRDREGPYLHFVLRALHESRQTYPDAGKGEGDRVRHWLVNDPDKLDHLVTEIVSCTSEFEKIEVTSPQVIAEWLREASDLWTGALSTAYKFRDEHAQDYGLGDEVFADGVLKTGYPMGSLGPWTSEKEPRQYGIKFLSIVCNFLSEWWSFTADSKASKKKMPVNENGKPHQAPSSKVLLELAQRLPFQTGLAMRQYEEFINKERNRVEIEIEDEVERAQKLKGLDDRRIAQRRRLVAIIAPYNEQGAIKLAEGLEDTYLLVNLNLDYLSALTVKKMTALASKSKEIAPLDRELQSVQDHAESYYDKFGNLWANSHFTRNLQDGDLIEPLREAQANDGSKQHYLTWFLEHSKKSGRSVDKISWINDVVGERKYSSALKTLGSMSTQDDSDLWEKRTETCLAKLAQLAADEESEKAGADRGDPDATSSYDNAIELMDIQENLLNHVLQYAERALDTQAAQDLIMDTFGKKLTKKNTASRQLLRQGVDALVDGKALTAFQLVDILTLMDPVPSLNFEEQETPDIYRHEFSLALRVVDLAVQLGQPEKQSLQRLIWRRAMIRDDWLKLNSTSLKDDATVEREMQDSALFHTLVQVLFAHTRQPEASMTLCTPQEVLDSEVFPLSLQQRFEGQMVDRVETEAVAEQERLKSYVEKGRLEIHFGGLVRSAEDSIRAAADAAGDVLARTVLGETAGTRGRDVDPIDLDDMAVSQTQTNGVH